MNTIIQEYKEKKEILVEKLNNYDEDLSLKSIYYNEKDKIFKEDIQELRNLRIKIIHDKLPYLKETLLPFTKSPLIKTFNIEKSKIEELINDEKGDKILKALDKLTYLNLKMLEMVTKIDLSFYYEIMLECP